MKYYVIGNPINHSLSPILHNVLMKNHGIDASYTRRLVKSEELGDFFEELRREGGGCNITLPHKSEAVKYMDECEEDALKANSVNTVVARDGKLYGASTDAPGFVLSAASNGVKFKNKRVTIYGSGGVSAPIAMMLAREGAKVSIAGRTAERVARACELSGAEYAGSNLSAAVRGSDIFINTTSLGMAGTGTQFANFRFLRSLEEQSVVIDLIYTPRPTELLRRAAQMGFKTMDGLAMLFWQGALSFEKWFGVKATMEDCDEAMAAMLDQLANR